jgi:SAM-dependent methyltransferase
MPVKSLARFAEVSGTTVGHVTEFPDGFFDRADETSDADFYSFERLVTHIDSDAIAAVGALYAQLGLTGDVLDLCSSWVSHFVTPPRRLVALGLNAAELAANAAATDTLVHDLNVDPTLPFDDVTFDAVTCCVSIDYLTRPIEVFDEIARVLRPGGVFVVTFSNRCFPSKAIRAWLAADDRQRCSIVATYFALSGGFATPAVELRNQGADGDPLYAIWAQSLPDGIRIRSATTDDQSIVDEPPIERYHADFGSRPGDIGRIAVDRAGDPIGAAWLRRLEGFGFVDADTPELGIAVVADRRGRGVGTALLRSLTAAVPRMSLSVDRRNPAMSLYARVGFVEVRTDGEHSVTMLIDETRQ